MAIVSPKASTEALFLARRVLAGFDWSGAYQVTMGEEAPLAGVPNLALRPERAANVKGAELLGYANGVSSALQVAQTAAVVLVLDEPDVPAPGAGALIYLGTTLPESARGAAVVLPIANMAEEEGTFVNRDGRVQRYFQAKSAPGMARPAWWALGELLDAPAADRPDSAAAAFDLLAGTVEGFAGLSYATLGLTGKRMGQGAGVPA